MRPKDLKTVDFGKVMRAASGAQTSSANYVRVSDPRHVAPPGARKTMFEAAAAPDADGSPSGNRVSIETQMMKVGENKMQYELASTIYRKGLGLLRAAASSQR